MENFIPTVTGILSFLLELYLGKVCIDYYKRYHVWTMLGLGIGAVIHGLISLYMALDPHYYLWYSITGATYPPTVILLKPVFTIMLGLMVAHLEIRKKARQALERKIDEEILKQLEEL